MRRAWVGAAAALGLVLAGGGLARSLPSHRAADAATMAATTGQLRTYYIAAEEVLWDYAPHDRNDIAGDR